MTEPTPAAPAPRVEQKGARLHPLTPFVKGWIVFVAVALALFNNEGLRENLKLAGIGLGAALVGGILLGTLSWWFTKWQLTDDAIRVDSGFLYRRTRIIRFDRIQAIDVAQPFVARLLGMAELRMDVAGGGKSDGKLSYFKYSEAVELRTLLLVRAKGEQVVQQQTQLDQQPEPEALLVVPTGRLLGATLLSSAVLGSAAALFWVIVGAMVFDFHVGLFAALPLLLGVVQPIWKQVVGNHGFTLSQTDHGLRTKRGLFDVQRQTIPPGRVQGLLITEPLIWRMLGWSRVELDIAGVAGGKEDGDNDNEGAQLLPVGERGEVNAVLGRVLPGFDLDAIELQRAPERAKWLRPIGWRYLAYGADEQVFVTTAGWVSRRTSIVLHHKTQSVRLAQGPIQRRLNLADVHIDTPQGPTNAVALHRSAEEAAWLTQAQAHQARQARQAIESTRPDQS